MKLIPLSFQSNIDKCGICTFSFVKKDDSTNVMIYKRVNNETQATAYEVFVPKFVKKGSPLPNRTVVQEDYLAYPGSSAFGKTAYFCTSLDRAEIRFNELIERVKNNRGDNDSDVSSDVIGAKKPIVKGIRGRRKVVRPQVVFPKSSKSFVMKDLLSINKTYSQPTLYVEIQQLIKNNKVKVVGTKPNESGRGKKMVIYSVVD